MEASLAWPLTRWLCEYLGMVPEAVQVTNEDHFLAVRLKEYLESIGAGAAWNAEMSPDAPPQAVFANDAVILRLMSQSKLSVGIDLTMPSKDILHFVPRSVLGPAGTSWMLENLCNGLWRLVD